MTTRQQTHHYSPTSHGAPVLAELLGVSKHFGEGAATVQAVRGLDLEVRAGELLAVLGPNGAGKSTAIGHADRPDGADSGNGATVRAGPPRHRGARRRLGVMLQASGVPDTLRVRELLTAFRGYYAAPLPLTKVIAAAGLAGLENRLFGDLSGGQQRRVLFGIALCGDPDLLMFDEPTTGLDRGDPAEAVGDAARTGPVRARRRAHHPLPRGGRRAGRPDRRHGPRTCDRRGNARRRSSPSCRPADPSADLGEPVAEARQWPEVRRASREGPWLSCWSDPPSRSCARC